MKTLKNFKVKKILICCLQIDFKKFNKKLKISIKLLEILSIVEINLKYNKKNYGKLQKSFRFSRILNL